MSFDEEYRDPHEQCAAEIARLRSALEAIAPHLTLSDEAFISTGMAWSRAEELRRKADSIERLDAAIRQVRAALSQPD